MRYPQLGMGYSPARAILSPPPPQAGYAVTRYAAAGTPLAVSRRRTFLSITFAAIYSISILKRFGHLSRAVADPGFPRRGAPTLRERRQPTI